MKQKIQAKDLINVGIFTAIMFVVTMAAAMLGYIPVFIPLLSVLIGGGSGGAMNVIKPVLTAVPLLLFLCSGKWKAAVVYTTVYTFAFAGEIFLVPVTTGFVNFIVIACCGMFALLFEKVT